MSFRFIFWLAVGLLIISASAGWIFFGTHEPDPEQVRQQIAGNILETARKQAESGDVQAWTAYGRALIEAPKSMQDPKAAMTWFRKAADKGYPPAQVGIGDLYTNGLGVPEDHYRATEWYELAARLSRYPEAHFKLGEAYFRGIGVPQDYGAAVPYYRTAAAGGHPVARYILGSMYEAGWGVDRDLIKAWLLYKRAMPDAARIIKHEETYDVAGATTRIERDMNRSQREAAEKLLKAEGG